MTLARAKLYKTIALHALMLALVALFLLPFVWMVMTSFQSDSLPLTQPNGRTPGAQYIKRPSGAWREVLQTEDLTRQGQPGKLRAQITDWSGAVDKSVVVDADKLRTRRVPIVRHYLRGLTAFGFALYLRNTVFVCLLSVAATTLTSALVAYAFSVLRWPGRDLVFYLVLGTMIVPAQMTMVPVFQIYRHLGWMNTYGPLVIGSFFGNAFCIFLLRQFFLTIPRDLVEAARVDGCPEWRIFGQVILPLSLPALAMVALFAFFARWNDFLTPLIYLADAARYTLSLGLAKFQGQASTRYGELMAMSVVLMLPIVVLFSFTQKSLIRGVKTILPK